MVRKRAGGTKGEREEEWGWVRRKERKGERTEGRHRHLTTFEKSYEYCSKVCTEPQMQRQQSMCVCACECVCKFACLCVSYRNCYFSYLFQFMRFLYAHFCGCHFIAGCGYVSAALCVCVCVYGLRVCLFSNIFARAIILLFKQSLVFREISS